MMVSRSPYFSHRRPLLGIDDGAAAMPPAAPAALFAVVAGSRFLIPLLVAIGYRMAGRRWGVATRNGLVAAGVLHLVGGVVLGVGAAGAVSGAMTKAEL